MKHLLVVNPSRPWVKFFVSNGVHRSVVELIQSDPVIAMYQVVADIPLCILDC